VLVVVEPFEVAAVRGGHQNESAEERLLVEVRSEVSSRRDFGELFVETGPHRNVAEAFALE